MRTLLSVVTIVLATPAIAQAVLPIDGIFGNAAGCRSFMVGQVVGEDVLLLTPDTVNAYTAGCDFVSMTEHTRTRYAVSAVCSSDASDGPQGAWSLEIFDRGHDGMFVRLKGFPEWGPMFLCPDTEEALAPNGVQI